MRQSSSQSPVGTTLRLTAEVDQDAGCGLWSITVSGVNDKAGGPRALDPSPGGMAQRVTASYTGERSGSDTITAAWQPCIGLFLSMFGEGSVGKASVVHTWAATVSFDDPKVDALVGNYAFLHVTVQTGSSEPTGHLEAVVKGVTKGVEIKPFQSSTSGGAVHFSLSYPGDVVGRDEVTATWFEPNGDGDTAMGKATATVEWQAPQVELTVLTSDEGSGTNRALDLGQTATAHVELPDGDLGGTLTVEIVAGPHAGPIRMTRISGGSEEADVYEGSWKGVQPGRDRVRATLTVDQSDGGDLSVERVSAQAVHAAFTSDDVFQSWNTPATVITQPTTTSLVGETTTFSALVTGTTEGVLSVALKGPNAGTPVTLDATGFPVVVGSYTGGHAGTDLIVPTVTAFEEAYESAASAVSHDWVLPSVVVSQDTLTSVLEENVQLAATVVPDVPGTVVFSVAGPGGPLTIPGDGVNGSFTASYTRDVVGTDTITATLTATSGTTFDADPIQHEWTPKPDPRVVLSSPVTASCLGDTLSSTATVTDRGAPVPGSAVRVEVSRAEEPALTLPPGATGPEGQATFSYDRTSAGLDTLVATATVNGTDVTSAPLPHVWQACALTVTIAPADTTSTVNSDFSPTVRVSDGDGRPVEGAAVVFRATMPGSDPVAQPLTTGPDGTATTTYKRTVAGTDQLEASATAGPRNGQGTTTHIWEEAAAAGLTLSLDPPGASTQAGTDFTVTATLLDGGKPLTAAGVDFVTRMQGAADIPGTSSTDSAGRAMFTYKRLAAGPDDVNATVTLPDGRTAQAAVRHTWTEPPPPVLQDSADGTLVVRGIPVPEGQVTVVGTGCPAGSTVRLFIDGAQVATTRADGDGRFQSPVQLTGLGVGHYGAIADCPPVRVKAALDVIQPTSSSEAVAARVSTAAAVLCFMVLLGSQVLRLSSGDPVGTS